MIVTLPKVITGPALEPLMLADVKDRLGIPPDEDTQDSLIDYLIQAAREDSEGYMQVSLISRTLEIALPAFANTIELPLQPVQSITSIKYIDTAGTEQTLDPAVYSLDTYHHTHRVVLAYDQAWPSARATTNAIKVRYAAGYGDTGDTIPQAIQHAMILMIDNWLKASISQDGNAYVRTRPYAAEQLLNKYRIWSV